MSRTTRACAAALAAAALALPLQAHAAPSASGAAPTTTTATSAPLAFVPVAALGADTLLAAPAEGRAYVASVTDGVVRVRLAVRTATGVTLTDVALPTGTSTARGAQLAAAGGRGYLLLTGESPRLFALDGTRATELVVPRTGPGGSPLTLLNLAADAAGSIWVSGYVTPGPDAAPGTGYLPVAFHGDGATWTSLPPAATPSPWAAGWKTYAAYGHYFEITPPVAIGKSTGVREWNGSTWVTGPTTGMAYQQILYYRNELTFASANDYTTWGHQGSYLTHTAHGSCQRVVDGTAQPVADCAAPAWPVSAAVRLADGRVVLGGEDVADGFGLPAAAPAGFAVVPTPGATPVAVRGDNGDRVVELASAGTTVWALTTRSGVTTLQVAGGTTQPPAVGKPTHKKPKPPQAKRHPSHPVFPVHPGTR